MNPKESSLSFKNIFQRETKLASYIIVCMTIVILGISYALFFQVDKNSKNQVVKAGDLTFTYTDGNQITSTDKASCFDPMGLDDANLNSSSCSYQFSVTNSGSLKGTYTLKLVANDSNTMENTKLKVILKKKVGDILTIVDTYPKLISTLTDNTLISDTIDSKETIVYSAQIYVDETLVTSTDANKTVSYQIQGTGIVNDSQILGDYIDTSGANQPELYQGLIPVKYDASGNTVVADTTTEWYDYSKHNWANAVLVNAGDSTIKDKYFDSNMKLLSSVVGTTVTESDILQYYVWIPRYKYLLWNAENGSSNEQAISITFEKNTDTKSTGSTNGTWLTHPAFTFGSTELSGFWAGKFETSNNTTTPKVIPNVESLVSTSVGNAFNSLRSEDQSYASTYGLSADEIDTHMMKNMEWGAIAYLTNSIYGRYTSSGNCISSGCEVWINNTHTGTGCGVNSDYSVAACGGGITGCSGSSVSAGVANSMTACASGYDWKQTGVNASTTGNQYGIYDMSGGAWEYVMGNMVNSSGNYYSSSAGLAQPNTKYYDSYAYSESVYTDHARGLLGDATKETLKTFGSVTGGWYSDYAGLPSGTSSWFARGGYAHSGSSAGVFYFARYTGGAATSYSFRSVLSAE